MLELTDIRSFYGAIEALKGVSIEVRQGEIVALIGANGAGKSTLLMTIFGSPRARHGAIHFLGQDISKLKTHEIARLGIAQAPEGRRVFPRLRDRRRSQGTDLSGGEQQMLAIARALVRDPKVLLLDEPFEGLAPVIVRDLLATCRQLADAGQTIVLVEQNIAAALSLASRAYIINNGHVVETMSTSELRARPEVLHRYLGV